MPGDSKLIMPLLNTEGVFCPSRLTELAILVTYIYQLQNYSGVVILCFTQTMFFLLWWLMPSLPRCISQLWLWSLKWESCHPFAWPFPWAASSCWAVGGLCWCVGKRRGFQRFTESQNILGRGGPTRGIESNSFLSWALECSHTSSGLVRVKAVERSDLRNMRCWGFYSLHT